MCRRLYRTTADESTDILAHITKLREIQEQLHLMGSYVSDDDFPIYYGLSRCKLQCCSGSNQLFYWHYFPSNHVLRTHCNYSGGKPPPLGKIGCRLFIR
jgi:hypothetical protein